MVINNHRHSIFGSTLGIVIFAILFGCTNEKSMTKTVTARDILGNPAYPAISYGGYREKTRDEVPEIEELKQDMRILSAMGIKIIRTYNTQQYAHAANLLQAIDELGKEDSGFEMYVMLGVWIDCEGAWTDSPNHEIEDEQNNQAEIAEAVRLTNQYPEIVKVIAVGNEAMVHWASSYFVHPRVILRWVNYLQELKGAGGIPWSTWITSSDNFASWGGGDSSYHNDELIQLIQAVDYVSLHTYPFHDTHYNPAFWVVEEAKNDSTDMMKIESAMRRAVNYAQSQYQSAADYIAGLGINKQIHIGETGWASLTNSMYGHEGSKAADEYKQKLYYEYMREWTDSAGISCFYFEAFDEQWKDAKNPLGSENHFGLINLQGQAKLTLWDLVDAGSFDGLERDGFSITKTFDGDQDSLIGQILAPETLAVSEIKE